MQQNEDQTPYHGELNEAGQPSMRSILAEMDAKNGLGPQAQLSGVDRHLVVEAAKNGQDVNTGEPLQPGQTPPPLEGSHPATHQEQAEIAQPYQTEREEMARASIAGMLNNVGETIRDAGETALEGGKNLIGNVYENALRGPSEDDRIVPTGPEAAGVWGRLDLERDMHEKSASADVPIQPTQISSEEFDVLLNDEVQRTDELGVNDANYFTFLSKLRGASGDSSFFRMDRRGAQYKVEGYDEPESVRSEDGSTVGSNINQIRLGMIAAAAGKPFEVLVPLIKAHNEMNIWAGQDKAHNEAQKINGPYWAKIGYDAYMKRKGLGQVR